MAAAIANVMRKPPPPSAFFSPAKLSDVTLLTLLVSVAGDIVSAAGGEMPRYQRGNARRLIRRIRTLFVLFDYLLQLRRPLSSSAVICFKELYIVVHRARILLDYCFQSSRLWLLICNREIAGYFQDLEGEISTLVDVLPVNELRLTADVREHVELLRRQVGSSKMDVDGEGDELRIQVLSFLEEFGKGRTPDLSDLKSSFIDRIGMADAGDFEDEIEFLQNQIFNHEGAVDAEADLVTISGVIAVVRYSRFSLFGTQEAGRRDERTNRRAPLHPPSAGDICGLPKDFCCPISLELMRDPVVVSTGQTYDRHFITQWIADGHRTCPNSGQNLVNATLIPNRAIRSLISHWCAVNDVACNSFAAGGGCGIAASTKAVVEANRATIRILVDQLSSGENASKAAAAAARELRMLAKICTESRAMIGEDEKAIAFLSLLLRSPNPTAQENAVTSLLNLSIHDANKARIMKQPGCLRSIIGVLHHGLTTESRENAAATVFSLSAIDEYKRMVVEEPTGVEALVGLLKDGSLTGKRNAMMALMSLARHPRSWERMVGAGAVEALVGMMREGSERGRENAAAALHEMCRRGGERVVERVGRVAGVERVVERVAVEGTKRARGKAAAIARLLQRRGRGWGLEWNRETATVGVPVSVV